MKRKMGLLALVGVILLSSTAVVGGFLRDCRGGPSGGHQDHHRALYHYPAGLLFPG